MSGSPETMYDQADVDLNERGTRRPRHQGVVTTPSGRLQPFMAAPLRPNETITNLKATGWSIYSQMVKQTASPPLVSDLLFVKVPVSALGPEMMDIILQDLDDPCLLYTSPSPRD